jgi:8-amino-7-oxononanoate synthase
MTAFARQDQALAALKARGRYRSLVPREGCDFSSNDYLGLAGSEELRQAAAAALARGVPVGAGGSRLLRGNDAEHERLEAEAAQFFGTEAALFMGGGFNANLAIFSTLPQHGDLVLYDALIHASTHDGMRQGRAETRSFAHNDVEDCTRAIAEWKAAGGQGQVWIAVEALYSMDGDIAPLSELSDLAIRDDAVLVVDEAHSTGLFGNGGRGLADNIASAPHVLSLHTCGKGLGGSGALICGQKVLIETLVNKARTFIFATAPSPLNAALVRAALSLVDKEPDRRQRAWDTIRHAWREADRLFGLKGCQSQIIPVVIGCDKRTMRIAETLRQSGFDIRGVRPPTVPRGTARLRISITANVTPEQVTAAFTEVARQLLEEPV